MEDQQSTTKIEAALYLIPVELSDVPIDAVLPSGNAAIVRGIKHFIVENVRSARRFIKRCDRSININDLTFYPLNRHTAATEAAGYLAPLVAGEPMGVISEAGCPAVADPGADVVALAQQRGLRVKPLVGPSSIIMGLMGSGFNGQSFAFLGYLPIDNAARTKAMHDMERRIVRDDQTQIFIETPYRNNALIEQLVATLPPTLRLCIASDITGAEEHIVTHTIAQWRQLPKPDCNKRPTIFLLYR